MKRSKRFFTGLLILVLCCMFPIGAQAATAKKLFSLKISDGAATKTVPVYQYKEANGTIKVDVKSSQKTLTVNALAKNLQVSVADKQKTYTGNYKSVSYIRTPKLAASRDLSFFVKDTKGKVYEFKLKIVRPAKPSITSLKANIGATGFKTGQGSLTITMKTKAQVACKTTIRVKNSAGKYVYSKSFGKKTSGTFTLNWSGKPSAGNQAGLSASQYVPSGTYKVTGYVRYAYGKVSKVYKKTISITVKNSDTDGDVASFKAKDWNWKVTLTGNNEVDYLCEYVCQKTLTNGMSDIAKAKKLYTWIGQYVKWDQAHRATAPEKIPVSNTVGQEAVKAYAAQAKNLVAAGKANVSCNIYGNGQFAKTALSKGLGDCWNMSDAYVALLRHAGIDAATVGHARVNGAAHGHYWTMVKISGKYYYADVNQYSNSYYDLGISNNYYYFLCGSNSCYNLDLYNTVDTGKYPLAKQVSKTDCPGR